jgi:leucyl-tRNA synthetase
MIDIVVQVNGKDVTWIPLANDATEDAARVAVAENAIVLAHIRGKTEKKFLYVPGRIINITVA